MSNNEELLQAIGRMMDEKLQSSYQMQESLRKDVDEIKSALKLQDDKKKSIPVSTGSKIDDAREIAAMLKYISYEDTRMLLGFAKGLQTAHDIADDKKKNK